MFNKFRCYFLCSFLILFFSCNGQIEPNVSEDAVDESPSEPRLFEDIDWNPQIGNYLVEVYEDKTGTLWFGTISKGIARYDGTTLTYLDSNSGLPGNAVVNMIEDGDGNIWFSTHSGLSKYREGIFTNYTTDDGLCHNHVSNLLIDSKGNFWVGTWDGVCLFDGETFAPFPLPIPDVELLSYQSTMNWITEIMEDDAGNIWFGRDAYGACKYNPVSGKFTHFTKKDGLASNNVQSILEDKRGDIWFASRVTENDHPDPNQRTGDGGLSRYDGQKMIQFPEMEGLSKNDVYLLAEERNGDIWICAVGTGLYKYNGTTFDLYPETDRPDITKRFGAQSFLEDSRGRIWFGFSGGLFRLEGERIINITQNGPWE